MFFAYHEILSLLLQFKYLILFPFVMFEGPVTTLIAGFLSSLGYMHFWLAYFLVTIADIAGDIGYYALGRWGRERIIIKYGHYVGITVARVEKLENQFKKHGGKMLVFGKIADPLSSTIQTAAGITKMDFKKYMIWNVSATFPKSLILITIGFYFGEAINQIDFYRQTFGIIMSALGVLVIAAYIIYRKTAAKRIIEE